MEHFKTSNFPIKDNYPQEVLEPLIKVVAAVKALNEATVSPSTGLLKLNHTKSKLLKKSGSSIVFLEPCSKFFVFVEKRIFWNVMIIRWRYVKGVTPSTLVFHFLLYTSIFHFYFLLFTFHFCFPLLLSTCHFYFLLSTFTI